MLRASLTCSRALLRVWAIALGFTLVRAASAATCDPMPITPKSEKHDKVLEQAREAAHSGRLAEARSLFYWLTQRQPTDQEAWLGVSLVNAWDGCLQQAEEGFRYMLKLNPRDVEARAGLIDVLTWETRWDEVWANIDAGLALAPKEPTLLLRQAKLLFWSGNVTLAADRLDSARHYGATGQDVRPLQRQLYSEQLRTMMRIDSFPAGYSNIYTWGMQGLQRIQRFELLLGTTLYRHSGGNEDLMVDGRHSLGVIYHPGIATTTGLSVGFGSPARWVPTFETKLWAMFPVARVFSAYFAYALWQYGTHKSVHMFAPALAYTVHDDFHLELRWWTSYVVLHTPPRAGDSPRTGLVNSVGLLGRVRLAPELAVGASYSYGIQLDENPIISRLFPLRSHIAAFFSDWTMGDHYGVQPMLGFERRRAPNTAVFILSAEMGVYWRW